jgi:hypothetical protein
MLDQNKISPKTYKRKEMELEKWVAKEHKEIKQTKRL